MAFFLLFSLLALHALKAELRSADSRASSWDSPVVSAAAVQLSSRFACGINLNARPSDLASVRLRLSPQLQPANSPASAEARIRQSVLRSSQGRKDLWSSLGLRDFRRIVSAAAFLFASLQPAGMLPALQQQLERQQHTGFFAFLFPHSPPSPSPSSHSSPFSFSPSSASFKSGNLIQKNATLERRHPGFFFSTFYTITISFSARFATSKGGATTKNNRDSRPKFLGVKKFGGQFVFPGDIIVRQRGTRFRAGEGVLRGGDDTLMAQTAGFVCMRKVQKNGSNNCRIKAGHEVSIHPTAEEATDPKREKLSLLRSLARSWMGGNTPE
ncbi:hypothetical protein Efla_001671 [Eimeria flavescens]